MDRRIFGIENEYGVTCTFKGQRRLSPDEVARYLFRKVVSWGRSSNVFLRNGARLYLDVGSHPEYATPECDDVIELVTHDKAGERVLEGLLLDAEQRLHDPVHDLAAQARPNDLGDRRVRAERGARAHEVQAGADHPGRGQQARAQHRQHPVGDAERAALRDRVQPSSRPDERAAGPGPHDVRCQAQA